MVNQLAMLALRFASTIILSRMLVPETFGLLAMVLFFQALIGMLNGGGFMEAAVQKEHLNLDQLNSAFWLNAALSAGLALLMMAGAPLIAGFYNEPSLLSITLVLGLVFFFDNIFLAHSVLLRRTMRSEIGAMLTIIPEIISLLLTVLLAFSGFKVWALVGGMMGASLVRRGFMMYFIRWKPGSYVKGTGLRVMLAYGLRTTAASMTNFLTRNLQTLALGKFASPLDVGYFNRGQSLFQIPMERVAYPVGNLIFPALAAVQKEGARVLDLVLKAVWSVALILMPISAVMMVFGDWILIWLIGDRWQPAGEVVRWMALSSVPLLFFTGLDKANAAMGRPGRGMPAQLASLPFLIGGIFLTAPHGAVAVSKLIALYRFVLFPVVAVVLLKGSGLDVRRFLRSSVRLALLFGIAMGSIFPIRELIGDSGTLCKIFCVLGSSIWVTLIFFFGFRMFEEGRSVLGWLHLNFGRQIGLPKWLFS